LGGEKAQNLALKIVAAPKIIYSIVPTWQNFAQTFQSWQNFAQTFQSWQNFIGNPANSEIFGAVENEKLFPT